MTIAILTLASAMVIALPITVMIFGRRIEKRLSVLTAELTDTIKTLNRILDLIIPVYLPGHQQNSQNGKVS